MIEVTNEQRQQMRDFLVLTSRWRRVFKRIQATPQETAFNNTIDVLCRFCYTHKHVKNVFDPVLINAVMQIMPFYAAVVEVDLPMYLVYFRNTKDDQIIRLKEEYNTYVMLRERTDLAARNYFASLTDNSDGSC